MTTEINDKTKTMTLELPAELHPNTADLVRRFAAALGQKLREAEVKYGYADGWMDRNWADACREAMVNHVAKGDPRDVAIYAAFLWHHGWHASLSPFFGELNARLIEALGSEVPPTPLLAKLPELLLKMRRALEGIATTPLRNFEDAEEFRTWARSIAAHALPGGQGQAEAVTQESFPCECHACTRDGAHKSDCAVHGGPALKLGPCDCDKAEPSITFHGGLSVAATPEGGVALSAESVTVSGGAQVVDTEPATEKEQGHE